jgi:outer membrane lipoprotein-sorting protein
MNRILYICLMASALPYSKKAMAQDAAALIEQLRAKLEMIKDYEADGQMKTNISFLKVPAAQVKIYFKAPNKLKIKNEKGLSLVPKGTVSMSLNSLLSGQYQALEAGVDKINNIPVTVIKLLPKDDNSEVVLSTLYVDVARLLILKAKTTTKDNGTNELALFFNKYEKISLPDKVIFTFSTKGYKLPKGVTFDYDDGAQKKPVLTDKNNKGKIEIVYSNYKVNKGLSDDIFK